MTCVVDSSVLMRLVETDARARRVQALYAPLQDRHALQAPELVNYEILHAAHRRQASIAPDLEGRQRIVATLLDGIEFVPAASGDRERIGALAEQYGLSAYDAAFLALAKTQPDALLATLDRRLYEAAKAELGERALDLEGLEEHLAGTA